MPTRQLKKFFFVLLLGSSLLSACHKPSENTVPTLKPGAVYTAAAQTVSAQLALEDVDTPQPPAPSTPQSTQVVDTNQTPIPESTQEHANPTETNSTIEQDLYDHMTFIDDVTYPDGAQVSPGERFTKIWRIKNTGTQTWTSGYSLIFDYGDAMGATEPVQLTKTSVEPGDIVDVEVELTAPEALGEYQGFWMIRNLEGKDFGVGDSSQPFWVKVSVVAGLEVSFDFNAYADAAQWGTGTKPIDYEGPGTDSLPFGPPEETEDPFVTLQDDQTLENGRDSDWVLGMYPPQEEDSYLIGKYPTHTVNAGEHLEGKVGLLTNLEGNCGDGNVTFQIKYTIDNEISSMSSLWEGEERCDGTLQKIDIDLSDLDGKEIQFYLIIITNTVSEQNRAIWDSLVVKK